MEDNLPPKISIIVPIYNAEKTLRRCINSIIIQTYPNIEIILIDDGSDDNSLAVCKSYAEKDKRVKVFHQSNSGLVRTRKLGISLAEGDYIGFVDSDDWVDDDFYEALYKNIYDADFIHTGYILEKGETKRLFDLSEMILTNRNRLTDEIRKKMILWLYRGKIAPSIWSKLFKKAFIKDIYSNVPDDQQMGEDLITFRIGIQKATKICISNIQKYHYCVRSNSMSHQIDEATVLAKMNLLSTLKSILNNMEIYDDGNAIRSLYKITIESIFAQSLQTPNMYFIGNIEKLREKKIILFGSGAVGNDFYAQIKKYDDINLISWMDSFPEKNKYPWKQIENISEIRKYMYDFVIIAALRKDTVKSMKETLKNLAVSSEKVIYQEPLNLLDQVFFTDNI